VPAGDVAALVAAINTANGASGDDTIVLAAGSTYSLTAANNSPQHGPNGLPVVTSTITIQGNGAIIERSAAAVNTFRLLTVETGGDLTIDQATLRKGMTDFDGGAIQVRGGTLRLTGCTLTDNHCTDVCLGGAIHHVFGTVEISDSTLSNNSAAEGGAIDCFTSGALSITRSRIVDNVVSHPTSLTDGAGIASSGFQVDIRIVDSTISGNQAIGPAALVGSFGGGISDTGGSIWRIERSTISGNSVTVSEGTAGGAGIWEGGAATVTILNSTITDNHCTTPSSDVFRFAEGGGIEADGGGIWTLNNVTISGNTVAAANGAVPRGSGIGIRDVASMTIRNSIVAGNGGASDCFTLNTETIASGGHNLVQDATNCTITAGTADLPLGQSPLLGSLADNGGPTQTRALLVGSPALEAGDPAAPGSGGSACEATDQRGLCRPGGTTCDIGAFEKDGIPCATTTTTTTLPPAGCIGAPTFEDIDCRLDILVAMVQSAQDLGRLKNGLVKSITKARRQKQRAEGFAPSSAKKAKKNLKKAAHTMWSFVHKLKSLSAKKVIPEETRNALRAKAEPIAADMKTLLSAL